MNFALKSVIFSFRFLEMLFLFIALPFLYTFPEVRNFFRTLAGKELAFRLLPLFFLFLFVVVAWLIIKTNRYPYQEFFRLENVRKHRSYGTVILKRFLLVALFSSVFTAILYRENLFYFIRNFGEHYKLVMVVSFFYPVLSVFPQEFLFRVFFVLRYGKLFVSSREMVTVNSLLFMFVHVIYENWIAMSFTFAGNFFFMKTFLQTRSFWFVFLEHSLYGLWLFYTGLGRFFYNGS